MGKLENLIAESLTAVQQSLCEAAETVEAQLEAFQEGNVVLPKAEVRDVWASGEPKPPSVRADDDLAFSAKVPTSPSSPPETLVIHEATGNDQSLREGATVSLCDTAAPECSGENSSPVCVLEPERRDLRVTFTPSTMESSEDTGRLSQLSMLATTSKQPRRSATSPATIFRHNAEGEVRRYSSGGTRVQSLLKGFHSKKELDDPRNKPRKGQCLPDAEDMKRQVREALAQGQYSVKDYYKETGTAQLIARSTAFEIGTLLVISLNAIWIAIDTDHNKADSLVEADPVFQVVENLFCTYFTFELAVRYTAFKDKKNCLKDNWLKFDTLLAIMMIIETWVLSVIFKITGSGTSTALGGGSVLKLIRLTRLSRMARMAKLLRAVPELVILIKGIMVASRSVFFTLVLLIIIVYFFGVVFRQLTDGSEIGAQYYPSVGAAMRSLLLDYILADQSKPIRDHGDDNFFLGILSLVYMLLAGLTVMNMLVGVLVEVITVVSSVEKEQLQVSYVKTRLDEIFDDLGIDNDGSRTISKAEFQQLLVNREAAQIIQDIGVDVYAFVDLSDFIFEGDVELDFPSFMEVVLQMRGTNIATVKDIVDLRKFLSTELVAMEERLLTNLEKRRTSSIKATKKSQGPLARIGASIAFTGQASLVDIPGSLN